MQWLRYIPAASLLPLALLYSFLVNSIFQLLFLTLVLLDLVLFLNPTLYSSSQQHEFQQLLLNGQHALQRRPHRKVLWIVNIIVVLGQIVFKTVILSTSLTADLSESWLEFCEIDSWLTIILPSLLTLLVSVIQLLLPLPPLKLNPPSLLAWRFLRSISVILLICSAANRPSLQSYATLAILWLLPYLRANIWITQIWCFAVIIGIQVANLPVLYTSHLVEVLGLVTGQGFSVYLYLLVVLYLTAICQNRMLNRIEMMDQQTRSTFYSQLPSTVGTILSILLVILLALFTAKYPTYYRLPIMLWLSTIAFFSFKNCSKMLPLITLLALADSCFCLYASLKLPLPCTSQCQQLGFKASQHLWQDNLMIHIYVLLAVLAVRDNGQDLQLPISDGLKRLGRLLANLFKKYFYIRQFAVLLYFGVGGSGTLQVCVLAFALALFCTSTKVQTRIEPFLIILLTLLILAEMVVSLFMEYMDPEMLQLIGYSVSYAWLDLNDLHETGLSLLMTAFLLALANRCSNDHQSAIHFEHFWIFEKGATLFRSIVWGCFLVFYRGWLWVACILMLVIISVSQWQAISSLQLLILCYILHRAATLGWPATTSLFLSILLLSSLSLFLHSLTQLLHFSLLTKWLTPSTCQHLLDSLSTIGITTTSQHLALNITTLVTSTFAMKTTKHIRSAFVGQLVNSSSINSSVREATEEDGEEMRRVRECLEFEVGSGVVNLLGVMLVDGGALVVIICALLFRLSIGMCVFLAVYLLFFRRLFSRLHDILVIAQAIQLPKQEINRLQRSLFSEHEFSTLHHHVSQENIIEVFTMILKERMKIKQSFAPFLLLFTVLCLLVNHAAQALLMPFTFMKLRTVFWQVEWVLFAVGVSAVPGGSFIREAYFYLLMVGVLVAEQSLYTLQSQRQANFPSIYQSIQLSTHILKPSSSSPAQTQTCKLQRDYTHFFDCQGIEQDRIIEDYVADRCEAEPQQIRKQEIVEAARYLSRNQEEAVWMGACLGEAFISMCVRVFLLLMLVNSFIKYTIFSWLYMLVSLYFWRQPLSFSTISNLSLAAIVFLGLQYLVLLLNITPLTSPLSIPVQLLEVRRLSVIGDVITDAKLLEYLSLGGNTAQSFEQFKIGFIINSVIIFATELYFFLLSGVSRLVLNRILAIRHKFNTLLDLLSWYSRKIMVNHSACMPITMTFFRYIYCRSLDLSHILVGLVSLLIISCLHVTIIQLLCVHYLLFQTWYSLYRHPEQAFLKKLFSVVIGICVLLLIGSQMLHLPWISTTLFRQSLTPVLIILFALQLWMDLNSSRQFQKAVVRVVPQLETLSQAQQLFEMQKGNEQVLMKLLHDQYTLKAFDEQIKAMQSAMKCWHDRQQVLHLNPNIFQLPQREQLDIYFYNSLKSLQQLACMNGLPLKLTLSKIDGFNWGQLQYSLKVYRQHYLYLYQQLQHALEQIHNFDPQLQSRERLQILEQWLEQQPQEQNDKLFVVQEPGMLAVNVQEEEQSFFMKWYKFLVSRRRQVVRLLISLYFLQNPALLSLPPVLLIFLYEIPTRSYQNQLLWIYLALVFLIFLYLKEWLDPSNFTFLLTASPSCNYLIFLLVLLALQSINLHTGPEETLSQAFLRLCKAKPQLFQQDGPSRKVAQPFLEGIADSPNKLHDAKISVRQKWMRVKAGEDLYVGIVVSQICMLLYVLFFYPDMVNKQIKGGLQTSIRYNEFSSEMVLAVLLHLLLMVIQRYITLVPKPFGVLTQLQAKLLLQLTTACCIAWFCWVNFPFTHNFKFESNGWMQGYMLLSSFYLFFSAEQLWQGYPNIKLEFALMEKCTQTRYYTLLLICLIPFLLELKLLMDWAFADTSLSFIDWNTHFTIHMSFYRAKFNIVKETLDKQAWYMKALQGWCGFIAILALIFVPMILFSGLNPVSSVHLIEGGSLSLGLSLGSSNVFELFNTAHFKYSPHQVDKWTRKAFQLDKIPAIASADARQLQAIEFVKFSDAYETMSSEIRGLLLSNLREVEQGLSNMTIELVMEYCFKVNLSQIDMHSTLVQQQLPAGRASELIAMLQNCNQTLRVDKFFFNLVQVTQEGNAFKAAKMFVPDSIPQAQYWRNITLQQFCTNQQRTWQVWQSSEGDGLKMFVLSGKYSSITLGFSIITLYTSVILVLGRLLRGGLEVRVGEVPYSYIPQPGALLQLCRSITLARKQGRTREQKLLFHDLLDILRSPQMLKQLGGSYHNFWQDKTTSNGNNNQ